jgi:hypothetical protein
MLNRDQRTHLRSQPIVGGYNRLVAIRKRSWDHHVELKLAWRAI